MASYARFQATSVLCLLRHAGHPINADNYTNMPITAPTFKLTSRPLATQHEAALIQKQQQLRQNATITIAHLLQGFGQSAWVAITLAWLNRYDGLECFLYSDEDPFVVTAAALATLVRQRDPSTALSAQELASLLVSQPFCQVRARAGFQQADREWDPAAESFHEFMASIKPVEVPNVWAIDYTPPSAEAQRLGLITELSHLT